MLAKYLSISNLASLRGRRGNAVLVLKYTLMSATHCKTADKVVSLLDLCTDDLAFAGRCIANHIDRSKRETNSWHKTDRIVDKFLDAADAIATRPCKETMHTAFQ